VPPDKSREQSVLRRSMGDAFSETKTGPQPEAPTRRRLVAGLAGAVGSWLSVAFPFETEARKRRARIRAAKRRRKRKRKRNDKPTNSNGGSASNPGPDPEPDPGPIDTTAQQPFPQHVAYANGTILPDHRSQGQLDDDVRAAYDRWKARYLVLVNAGDSRQYRVALGQPGSGNHSSTVSEGQGFGMMIAAHLAGYDPRARTICDGLWRYALAHRSCNDNRLMLWRIPNGGFGCSSATDGDLDIAYGLLLAHAQWGSDGPIDYRAAANSVLAGLLATTGAQSKLPMLGDWVNPEGNPHNQWTPRSSDLMPGHFRAFARASGDGAWNAVTAASLDVVQAIQDQYSPGTGLLPDFIVPASLNPYVPKPADAGFLEGANDGNYNYNAGRDPWRLGIDALLNGDSRSKTAVARISDWIATATGGNPQNIQAGYKLDGTPLASYFTTFFAAPFGVAAMTTPARQAWLNAVYDAVYQRQEDYYEDSVNLLCLLVMSGNFWDPTR
jgi:endo-1,4-beta-D-glucanase Y